MTEIFPTRGGDVPSQRFEESYERYAETVYRVCFSYIRNAAETEDIVADVFVKLLRRDIAFQNAENEKAWLLRTAINLCKDRLKHWWHDHADIDDYENIEAADPFRSDETLKLVLRLPARYKDVIYLYYYEGYSSAEIAGILKKPRSTVLNHLSEARKLLKEVLINEE